LRLASRSLQVEHRIGALWRSDLREDVSARQSEPPCPQRPGHEIGKHVQIHRQRTRWPARSARRHGECRKSLSWDPCMLRHRLAQWGRERDPAMKIPRPMAIQDAQRIAKLAPFDLLRHIIRSPFGRPGLVHQHELDQLALRADHARQLVGDDLQRRRGMLPELAVQSPMTASKLLDAARLDIVIPSARRCLDRTEELDPRNARIDICPPDSVRVLMSCAEKCHSIGCCEARVTLQVGLSRTNADFVGDPGEHRPVQRLPQMGRNALKERRTGRFVRGAALPHDAARPDPSPECQAE
jgi:hypothetical protein